MSDVIDYKHFLRPWFKYLRKQIPKGSPEVNNDTVK